MVSIDRMIPHIEKSRATMQIVLKSLVATLPKVIMTHKDSSVMVHTPQRNRQLGDLHS